MPVNWTKSNVTIVIEDEKSGLKEVTINGEEIEIGEDGKITYTINVSGEWEIVAKDCLENTSKATVRIDKVQPTLTVTGNPSNWTQNDVTLTIVASDSESGLNNVRVNGTAITLNNNGQGTYKVTQNGTYKIVVTDNLGNTQTKTETVNKIIEKMGDINKDNKINIADVIAVIRHIGSKEGDNYYLNEEKRAIADINDDGKINIADVIGILRLISNSKN